MNIEQVIIKHLTAALDVPVKADVPKNRPERFVTVERVGGQLAYYVFDHADIAVQAWAPTRHEASELIELADTAMHRITEITNITKVARNSITNFPDPDDKLSRYQGYYELIFYKED